MVLLLLELLKCLLSLDKLTEQLGLARHNSS
jgi:biotin operon repressor